MLYSILVWGSVAALVAFALGVVMMTVRLGWMPSRNGVDWREEAVEYMAMGRQLTDAVVGNFFRLWNWARKGEADEDRSIASIVAFALVSGIVTGLIFGGFVLKKQIANEVLAGMAGLAVPTLYFLSFTFELSVVNLVCTAMVMVEVMSGLVLSAVSNWKARILNAKKGKSVLWMTALQLVSLGTILSIILMEGIFGYLRASLEMDGSSTMSTTEITVLTIFMVVISMLVSGGTSFGSFFWEKLLVANSWFIQVFIGSVANTLLVIFAYLGRFIWSVIVYVSFVLVVLIKRDHRDDQGRV